MNSELTICLDFGLSEKEIKELERIYASIICEGGSEGWAG